MPKRTEPQDITKEKAFIAYMLTGGCRPAAKIVGVTDGTVDKWAVEGDWATTRQEYYDEVHKYTSAFLQEDLSQKQAMMAAKAIEWLEDMMLTDLRDAEPGTKLDLWKAFETGVNAISKLLGMSQGDKREADDRPLIQLSGEGQKIYLQSIQKLGIINNARDTEDISRNSSIESPGRRKEKYINGRQISIPEIDQDESDE